MTFFVETLSHMFIAKRGNRRFYGSITQAPLTMIKVKNFETRGSHGRHNLPWALYLSAYSLTRHAYYTLNKTGFENRSVSTRNLVANNSSEAGRGLSSFHFTSS